MYHPTKPSRPPPALRLSSGKAATVLAKQVAEKTGRVSVFNSVLDVQDIRTEIAWVFEWSCMHVFTPLSLNYYCKACLHKTNYFSSLETIITSSRNKW